MNIVVFDLEWNQVLEGRTRIPGLPGEIIQIGAAKIDPDANVIDTFDVYIKPVKYVKLNKHVKDLTLISEKDLEGGISFDEAAKNTLYRNPGIHEGAGGDWMHINNFSTLGENKWFDAGDTRFHPDNIIFDARNTNILGIIEKATGKIVWRLGPDFNESEATRKLGWIIGQHHLHMIPKGLPGEGDLLVFDNGGEAGYGVPNPASPNGV